MGNRSASRSFNTVKHSNRELRDKRQRQSRVLLLEICGVFIAILLTLLVFLCCLIGSAIAQNRQNRPSTNNNGSVKYTTATQDETTLHKGVLQLVNARYAYVFPSEANSNLITIYEKRTKTDGSNFYQLAGNSLRMNAEAFAAFERMMLAYYEISDGDSSIDVTSAYRSFTDQETLGSSVAAGHSDHHTGYCVALQQYDKATGKVSALDSSKKNWLNKNAHKYGFIVRYPEEKESFTGVRDYEYCYRYVGVPHATYIYQNNLCLEEYVTLLQTNYTGKNHLTVTDANQNSYEVYYVAASGEQLTSISVPKNYGYTVSGDNVGGYVVTVDLSDPRE